MEELRNMSVKVPEALHCKIRREIEAHPQTMSQFIETVLRFYFSRKDEKAVETGKRTLAFQVSEEFYQEVQEYIRSNKMKLKDFGIAAMRRMLEDGAAANPDEIAPTEQE